MGSTFCPVLSSCDVGVETVDHVCHLLHESREEWVMSDLSEVLEAIGEANDIDLCEEFLGSEVAQGFVDESQLLGARTICVSTNDDPYFVGEANGVAGGMSC
jgi:hypothetical protein